MVGGAMENAKKINANGVFNFVEISILEFAE